MRSAVFSAGLFVLMTLAPVAKAVPVEVTYSVSTVVNLPILATQLGVLTGTATVRYLGTGANTTSGPVGGFVAPARIQSFNVSGPLAFTVTLVTPVSPAVFNGFASLAVGANVNGAVQGLGGPVVLPIAGTAGGTIHCSGTGPNACAHPLLALTHSVVNPISLVFNTVLSDPAAFPSVGNILTLAGGFGTFGGVPLTATSTLNEVSRTAVPEPGTAALVWLGLAGLGGARWRARRRK